LSKFKKKSVGRMHSVRGKGRNDFSIYFLKMEIKIREAMGGVVQNFTKTGYDGECDAAAVRSTPPFQRPKERLPRRRRTAARVDRPSPAMHGLAGR
jgi:hypothetical protein